MLLKVSEFNFPDTVRRKYFPLVIRASPPEGWPRGTVVMSESKVPYRCFLQIIGASPAAEFQAEIGEYPDNDARIALSMLEEIALNCPLREDEAAGIKKDYETASTALQENRPPLFVQGLIPPIFCAFEAGVLSFSSALVLSLYTNAQVQWEIAGLGLLDKSPEAALKVFTDPFFPGDLLNPLEREPGRLKALGCDSLKDFLKERSPLSYGRSRFLMRLAAAIPPQKRAGLTSDHGELLLTIGKAKREALFRGQRISVDGREFDLKDLRGLNRPETRRLIRKRGKRWRSSLRNIVPASTGARPSRIIFRMTAMTMVCSS
jgi:hypothetical protein